LSVTDLMIVLLIPRLPRLMVGPGVRPACATISGALVPCGESAWLVGATRGGLLARSRAPLLQRRRTAPPCLLRRNSQCRSGRFAPQVMRRRLSPSTRRGTNCRMAASELHGIHRDRITCGPSDRRRSLGRGGVDGVGFLVESQGVSSSSLAFRPRGGAARALSPTTFEARDDALGSELAEELGSQRKRLQPYKAGRNPL
jgi:hypothetical protein